MLKKIESKQPLKYFANTAALAVDDLDVSVVLRHPLIAQLSASYQYQGQSTANDPSCTYYDDKLAERKERMLAVIEQLSWSGYARGYKEELYNIPFDSLDCSTEADEKSPIRITSNIDTFFACSNNETLNQQNSNDTSNDQPTAEFK